ncbi:YeiH family protein [Endozoicomonas euniceicola]|uniref:Sulfate exporter family transporter n=1 Tax=Endozoicomonas euniceicola TaxID=1234143 RepID=A0ABY6GXA5_9GAMM|nr:putative sulfate exporter family transporter [Endozoicomonas euniceicola]UYM17412.1 putative sulfate exporter family transporter [Endozoicomonas euniceicola]
MGNLSERFSKLRESSDWLAAGLFFLLSLICLLTSISSAVALLLGIILAVSLGNPCIKLAQRVIGLLLKFSVVGLGFGMSVQQAIDASQNGFLLTVSSIVFTLILGALTASRMGLTRHAGQLISSGTAICGGSAIAAVAPVIKAGPRDISVALGVVFILNSVALFVFPPIGHWLSMTQEQFGLWSAIAIHDTSSVVGASASYGAEALAIATTVKLGRALWIIPLSLLMAVISGGSVRKITIPWFIGLFILAMLANSFVPGVEMFNTEIVEWSKRGLVLTLFLIGSTMTRELLKSVGIMPMVYGIFLWVAIASSSLTFIMYG